MKIMNWITKKLKKESQNSIHKIQIDKVDCCENCGNKDYFVTEELGISHRRIRLCKECLKDLRDAINLVLKDENIMAKYRKKPMVIEAFQYDGDLKDCDGNWYVPNWAVEAYEKGIMRYASESCDAPPCDLFIETLEGIHHVSVWDYVIKGVNGELYPCKPDIFEKTYENI